MGGNGKTGKYDTNLTAIPARLLTEGFDFSHGTSDPFAK